MTNNVRDTLAVIVRDAEHADLNVPRGYRMAPTESEPDRIVRIEPTDPLPAHVDGGL